MDVELEPRNGGGVFEGTIPGAQLPLDYELEVRYPAGDTYRLRDPYSFLPTLGELDIHLAVEGRHEELYERLGAHPRELNGVAGVAFAVWAPNAASVSVVGDFNGWDGRSEPDALARLVRALGAVRPGRGGGLALQVRAPDARGEAAAEGRPARVPHGEAARQRVRRLPAAVRVGRRRLARAAARRRSR